MPRPTKRDAAALVIVVVSVGVAFRALTSAAGMPSGDHVDFYLWVHQIHQELAHGHWPQLLPDAIRGGGHALPRFYPPLAQAAAAVAYPLTGDILQAAHVSVLAGVLVSAATMFALLRWLGAGTGSATLGTLAYCFFPYRVTQLYVRGAFAESWTLAWYPLVMLGLLRWVRTGTLPWWWPLAVAATILSHAATSLWALPLLVVVAMLSSPGIPNRSRVRSLGIGTILSLGIAAFSLIPVAWYLPGVRASDPGVMAATASLVARSATVWAHPGVMALLELVLVGGAILLLRGRGSTSGTARLIGLSLLAQAVLVGMSAAPAEVWAWVPQPWRYVQFGWRLLGPATFLAALAFGLLAMRFRTTVGRGVIVLATTLVVGSGYARLRLEAKLDPGLTQERIIPWIGQAYGDQGLTGAGDYLPIDSDPAVLGRRIAATRDSLAGAGILEKHQRDGSFVLELQATSRPQEIPLPLVAYDTWRFRDQDGRGLTLRSDRGQWVVVAPAGTRSLRAERRLPPVVLLGMGLSLVSLVGVGWSGVRRRGG